jgi:hypothetical protein
MLNEEKYLKKKWACVEFVSVPSLKNGRNRSKKFGEGCERHYSCSGKAATLTGSYSSKLCV